MAQLNLPEVQPLPLRVEADGTVRVGRTRVTLDVLLYAFNEGETPEEIVRSFSTLSLADVYGVLAYYLRHREQVDEFLEQRRQEAEEIRRKIEELCPPDGLKERLLARQAQKT